jgi:MFS family permease
VTAVAAAVPELAAVKRARLAVLTVFFMNGLLVGTWISRIPRVKELLDLSPGPLGLLLLAPGAGALLAMQGVDRIIRRHGSGPSTRRLALLFSLLLLPLPLALMLPAPMPAALVTGLALGVFGGSSGALDVAMNAQAVVVERHRSQPIMSSFHGAWSVGGVVGGIAGALAAAHGAGVGVHFAVITVLAVALVGLAWRHLLDQDADFRDDAAAAAGTGFRQMPALVWLLGLIATCGMVAEGGSADWGGVYLRDTLHTSAGLAPVSYAVFSATMTIGRFSGDRLVARFGPVAVVRVMAGSGAVALALALLVGNPVVAIVGFGWLGLGLSCIVPVVFTAVGNVPGVEPAGALARVSSIGYTAFLVGPPLIGGIAQLTSLPIALSVLVILTATAAAGAGLTRPPARPPA